MTKHFVDAAGIWREVRRAPTGAAPRPALFLDRDGVIVEEVDYLHRVADVRLVPGAARVIAAANALELPVVVVTNQAGIGRGHYGWDEFAAVQARILSDLERAGAALDMVLACPFHPEGTGAYRVANHPARKPRPGMFLEAARALSLDMARSWVVGDRLIDLEAGRAAGLAGGLHVLTGHGARERPDLDGLEGPAFEVRQAHSIADAPDLIPLLAAAD